MLAEAGQVMIINRTVRNRLPTQPIQHLFLVPVLVSRLPLIGVPQFALQRLARYLYFVDVLLSTLVKLSLMENSFLSIRHHAEVVRLGLRSALVAGNSPFYELTRDVPALQTRRYHGRYVLHGALVILLDDWLVEELLADRDDLDLGVLVLVLLGPGD